MLKRWWQTTTFAKVGSNEAEEGLDSKSKGLKRMPTMVERCRKEMNMGERRRRGWG